jgi:hypothetical protein
MIFFLKRKGISSKLFLIRNAKMETHRIVLSCFMLVAVIVLLLGCSTVVENLSTKMLNAPPSLTYRATSFIANETTNTNFSYIASQEAVPALTQTEYPTLDFTQASKHIDDMMIFDEKCQKPCILGIIPDITTLNEARGIFSHFQNILNFTHKIDNKYYYSTSISMNSGIRLRYTIIATDDIVRNIQLWISLLNYNGDPSIRKWLAFSQINLMNLYGSPNSIDLYLNYPSEDPHPENLAWYTMNMHFESANLIVQYYDGKVTDGRNIRLCPLIDQYGGVIVWLGKNPENAPGKGISIREAATITEDQFLTMTRNNSQEACFNINPTVFTPTKIK